MTTPRAHKARTLAAGYARLGVQPNSVLLAPKVTHLLSSMRGGIPKAIEYLRASAEPAARAFILMYDDPSLSLKIRDALPLEAFCLAAKLDPTDLLAPITRVAHLHGAMLGAVKAAERHPEIVDASLAAAVTPDGVEDRMANLKHMGYLPSPRGSSVNVQVNASATAAAAAKSDAASLSTPEETIRRIIERRQQVASLTPAATQPALPAPVPESVPAFMPREAREPVTVDADYEEADE